MPQTVSTHGPHPVDRHVGRRVAEKRTGMGLTQSDLARALKLTFQQVQKYEKGTNRISASKLWDSAAFLGVDIDFFFVGLADDVAESDDLAPDHNHPPTRSSLEIARLGRQLSTRQQKLVLDLMTEMSGSGG